MIDIDELFSEHTSYNEISEEIIDDLASIPIDTLLKMPKLPFFFRSYIDMITRSDSYGLYKDVVGSLRSRTTYMNRKEYQLFCLMVFAIIKCDISGNDKGNYIRTLSLFLIKPSPI